MRCMCIVLSLRGVDVAGVSLQTTALGGVAGGNGQSDECFPGGTLPCPFLRHSNADTILNAVGCRVLQVRLVFGV
jgi:hypothetical protein